MTSNAASNPVYGALALGQSTWYDNISRGLLTSGGLAALVARGVRGVTSNPTIFERAVSTTADYDASLIALARNGLSPEATFEALAVEDVQRAADILRPVYDASLGVDGYCSLELPPAVAHDTARSIVEGRRLFAALGRPNVMVKVPATPAGMPAVRALTAEGVNVNVTLIFSLAAYDQVMEAYLSGLEDLVARGGDASRVASVASFFVSRLDTAVDGPLRQRIAGGEAHLAALVGTAAIANAQAAYARFQGTFGGLRFAALRARGARPQRPLWASTSTKDPAFRDTRYVDALIGPDTVNTMPDATLAAVLDHGRSIATLPGTGAAGLAALAALAAAGVDTERVAARLLAEGVAAFAASYDAAVACVAAKAARENGLPAMPRLALGAHGAAVERTLAALDAAHVVERIWRRDHTVWRPEPRDIADRLGWLTVTEQMQRQLGELQAFARQVRDEGVAHVVLLGMGGSVFAPEVLRQVFAGPPPSPAPAGRGPGAEHAHEPRPAAYPALIMLDSTVPGRVAQVTQLIDPARTLFIVSSKSGGTMEVHAFYRHFRAQVERAVGEQRAGQHFVAVTDAGTSLEALAKSGGFRRVFINPSDVGGRFSGLSLFGLVPAALTGVDVERLLASVEHMRQACRVPVAAGNPGAALGAAAAALAQAGVDKLILVSSPALEPFGLWAEQMLAESLGKGEESIVPIAGEPLAAVHAYGADHLFVYLRLSGDANAATDAHAAALEASGRPIVRVELPDRYALGGELFRWAFATVVAGHVLGLHPFDQPDVQRAKDFTQEGLERYARDGGLPEPEPTPSAEALMSQVRPGDYIALLAYVPPSAEVEAAAAGVRRAAVQRFGVATSFGYGPRYLHSTGQMHKAAANRGVFFMLTDPSQADLPVPGEAYSFRVLARAQALGDLRALQQRGRRVARLAPEGGPVAALADLEALIRAG